MTQLQIAHQRITDVEQEMSSLRDRVFAIETQLIEDQYRRNADDERPADPSLTELVRRTPRAALVRMLARDDGDADKLLTALLRIRDEP